MRSGPEPHDSRETHALRPSPLSDCKSLHNSLHFLAKAEQPLPPARSRQTMYNINQRTCTVRAFTRISR